MALDEYRRKRRFDETPEPEGKEEASPHRRFVVQKHQASHLHYDFRLEMDGVLKSWAVPKGPSLDPAEKRLAMMVEDHPVSYLHFEGVIPAGNYGGGTVMVWDTGVWEPLGDTGEMLRKGDLKFVLLGDKLKGEFVLAHMKSRRSGSKGTEWLLIKKKDDFAQPTYDIDGYAHSVLTGRTLEQIAADHGSDTWQSSRKAVPRGRAKNAWLVDSVSKAQKTADRKHEPPVAAPVSLRRASAQKRKSAVAKPRRKRSDASGAAGETEGEHILRIVPPLEFPDPGVDPAHIPGAKRAPMPRSVMPMMATLADKPFDDPAWLYEIKWDGYRAIAYVDDAKTRLFSRSGNDMTEDYPELQPISSLVHAKSAILDGEICALDESGRPSFSLMQQRTGFSVQGRR